MIRIYMRQLSGAAYYLHLLSPINRGLSSIMGRIFSESLASLNCSIDTWFSSLGLGLAAKPRAEVANGSFKILIPNSRCAGNGTDLS